MTLWRLILSEIAYRKLNFGLAVLSVAAATGCVAAVVVLLGAYDAHTEKMIADREAQTQADMQRMLAEREKQAKEEMARLEDEYRKITKDLGFNLYILHKDQDLGAFHNTQHASTYMPEDFGTRLAQSKVVTINHLLPILHEQARWPERDVDIHVIGTRGELAIVGADKKKPLRDLVPAGTVVLGYDLQKRLHLKQGDSVTFMGREFFVRKGDTPRGTFEDFTVWMNLADAQQLFGKEGKINVILALECDCQADRLDHVRAEVVKILPDTQIVEKSAMAEGRARARNQARATAAATVERVRSQSQESAAAALAEIRRERNQRREARQTLASVLVPCALFAATLLLGVLLFSNVRDRRSEIGILRAIGVSSWSVAGLVLARALLAGAAGALVGMAAGSAVGLLWAEPDMEAAAVHSFALRPQIGMLLMVPAWCAAASLMPALWAARQDPAAILGEV